MATNKCQIDDDMEEDQILLVGASESRTVPPRELLDKD